MKPQFSARFAVCLLLSAVVLLGSEPRLAPAADPPTPSEEGRKNAIKGLKNDNAGF